MGAAAWDASLLPSILEWRAWTADQTIPITAMTPTAAAIMRLRIRHLLADGTRIALAYGWQPQCEAFHTAEITFLPQSNRLARSAPLGGLVSSRRRLASVTPARHDFAKAATAAAHVGSWPCAE